MTRIAVPLLFTLCIAVASGDPRGQEKVWQPAPGHTQLPLWPGAAPDAQPVPGPEVFDNGTDEDFRVAGKPVAA